jgi:nicotinamidase-related amidase
MIQVIFFLLLALFVQSYFALNHIPTSSDIQSISNDNELTSSQCDIDCEIIDSFFQFQRYYINNEKDEEILKKIPTLNDFKKYLSEEGNLNRINNEVNKYAEKVGYCSDKSVNKNNKTVIVVTDMQYAFMSNGPVAVNGAEYAIDPINEAKKYHEYSIHSLDTHIPLWSLSFSTTPDYVNTFYPHARPGTDDFNEVYGLDTCVDLYIGKKDFSITSNPSFKEYLLKNDIRKVTFTGVAGDYCVYAGILGVLNDPQLSHIQVALYEPGVKWVFPDSISSQKSNLERYSKFKWIVDEEELLYFLKN